MGTIERLSGCVHGEVRAYILKKSISIREIHIRVGNPIQIISDEDKLIGDNVSADDFKRILDLLADHSLYSFENELREGFFTLEDGSRVGVCGKMTCENGRITQLVHAGSLSVRIARELKNCASSLQNHIVSEGKVKSTLVFSPPGFGKTTLLRDISRMLAEQGFRIAIADERHEIAACVRGIPTLDVGQRTDVADGCPKAVAIGQLIRSMSPQIIISDEIGDVCDARSLLDASRCGVKVMASAHGDSFESLSHRPALRKIIENGIFELGIRLDRKPGEIAEVRKFCPDREEGGFQWAPA